MTEDGIRKLVRREIELAGGTRSLARKWDVSPALLSKVVGGTCGPGPKILRHLGMTTRVDFVKAG